MSLASHPQRAAQYVRMSTEQQQYSTANQKDAIGAYAAACGIEIVATYEDLGKSGLTLSGRPSLRKLIADVVAGQDVFDTILVYDVSRWGRFQDADESAHLEYLCRLAGVRVEYCAEPFSNDGSPFASICKVVKRALAAEYSRELSDKVYAGKRRLIELGFRQGGSSGFGLRRCLVDEFGARKGLLSRGEYKCIATDRVILVPGPPDEVAIVRRIYRDYTERGMGSGAIAVALNQEGVSSESGRPWSEAVVKRVLTSEKYIGDSVWGRESFKLRMEHRRNAPTTWARFPGAFEGIVSRRLFDKAQRVRAARAKRVTDEQVVARLRRIYGEHGMITTRLIKEDGFLGTASIRRRFGSLISAYASAGFRPSRDLAFISLDGTARRLRATTARALVEGITMRGGTIEPVRGACRFLINKEITASVTVAQQRRSQKGNPRWRVKQGGSGDDLTIAVLMDGRQERSRAYYFLPSAEVGRGPLLAPRNPAHVEAFRSNDLEALFQLCARCDAVGEDLQASVSATRMVHRSPERSPEAPSAAKMRARRSRALSAKSYTGAFLRNSAKLREAIVKADAVQACLGALRHTLAGLLIDARFVRVLALQEVGTVPQAAFERDNAMQEQARVFQSQLRKQALDLLSGDGLSRRARSLLEKLAPARRIEAAEIMVLVNDPTEYHARALVAATPVNMLIRRPRKHIYGARPRELKTIVDESAYTYREAKRSLASFGRGALDLIALAAFARRLLAMPSVVGWLERHNRKALSDLKVILFIA